ncbi:MAG: AI-2E family transporter [Chitinivibrionales bacterium]|nr:AI-2E family transporter [Chitinivibrionales bacterium]
MNNNHHNHRSNAERFWMVLGVLVAMLGAIYVLRPLGFIAFMIFAGILAGILLDGIVELIRKHIHFPRVLALLLTVVAFLILAALGSWLIGPNIIDQALQLLDRVPEAAKRTKSILLNYNWGDEIWQNLTRTNFPAGEVVDRLTLAFSSTLGVIGNMLVIFFIGFYLALKPSVYINGFLKLIPPGKRERIRTVFSHTGSSLRAWLLARLISMIVVGILSLIGYLILDIQLALALAVIAGLLSFIPYLGPVLALIPALIVTVAEEPIKALYVLIVYSIVQVLESYLITPLVEQHATSVPAAFLITVQIVMAVVGGLMGILIATPLAVAGIVAIRMLYVEDVLHDSA